MGVWDIVEGIVKGAIEVGKTLVAPAAGIEVVLPFLMFGDDDPLSSDDNPPTLGEYAVAQINALEKAKTYDWAAGTIDDLITKPDSVIANMAKAHVDVSKEDDWTTDHSFVLGESLVAVGEEGTFAEGTIDTDHANHLSDPISLQAFPASVEFDADSLQIVEFATADVQDVELGLSDLQDGELEMIELQSLLSQRQMAIQLTTSMLEKLNETANNIAKNIPSESGGEPPAEHLTTVDDASTDLWSTALV